MKDGSMLHYADATVRAQRRAVVAAVRQDGRALGAASPEFQDDREIVLMALSQVGTALEFASDRLRHDPEIAAAAISRSPQALHMVPVKIRSHYFVRHAIEKEKMFADQIGKRGYEPVDRIIRPGGRSKLNNQSLDDKRAHAALA